MTRLLPSCLKNKSLHDINLEFFVAVAISVVFVLSLIILLGNSKISYIDYQSRVLENEEALQYARLYYDINIGSEATDAPSSSFFATNNEIEQIYGTAFNQSPYEFGQTIAVANNNLMAVSSEAQDGLLTVSILEKDSGGQWQESYSFSYSDASATNYKIPDNEIPTDTNDLMFGSSLAFNGYNTLAIGAMGWQGSAIEDDVNTPTIYEGDNGTNRGSVYIFQRQDATWQLVDTIRGSGAQAYFGSAISFSPNGTLAIGAKANQEEQCPNTDSPDTFNVPANTDIDGDNDIDEDDTHDINTISIACPTVHFYEQSNNSWNEIATISDNMPIAHFGASLAFANNDLIAVGAPYQRSPNRVHGEGYNRSPGAVRLYIKDSNGDWIQDITFSDFNTTNPGNGKYQIELQTLDRFGHSVAFLDANTLITSSPTKGILYILQKSNNVWSRVTEIQGDALLNGNPLHLASITGEEGKFAISFGQALAAYNDTIFASQPRDQYLNNNNEDADSAGVINLLNWPSFRLSTIWHYTYINDDDCGSKDFSDNPSAYNEGDLIEPPDSQEGSRLCFKADNGSDGIEYFASDIIDLSAPQFATPSLSISEDGVLSIYFNEIIRQIDNSAIDEDWVRNNVQNLNITLHGQVIPLIIPLNHDSGRSTPINDGNDLVIVEQINDRSVLKIQIDTNSLDFPPATAPTTAAPHTYAIDLKNFEDLTDNAQLTDLTAEQEITAYASSTPTITITVDADNNISATDSLGEDDSTLQYVWLDNNDDCDSTTDFSSATTYIEGTPIRLEETHNGQQICFKSTNNSDSNFTNYKSLAIDSIDRASPVITIHLSLTSISATDSDADATTWAYLILDDTACNSATDFTSANTYTEGTSLTVDILDNTQANKYYCFKASDDSNNITYKSSSQIGGSPSIQKIRLTATTNPAIPSDYDYANQKLFGIGANLSFHIYFDEPLIINCSERSIYLHVNSQPAPNSLNAYVEYTSDLPNGILSLRYVVQRNDATSNLQILEILSAKADCIQDVDGNNAILDLSDLVLVDENDQARTIEIDGFKPTITLSQPDMSAWETTKVVSAIDDDDGNDDYWDYYFISDEQANNTTPDEPLEIRCYLGDFLPDDDMGTPYHEGDEITLTEEHNGYHICFRSRRANPQFWDAWNRDRGGAMSDLIQNIDSTPPVINWSGGSNQITPHVTDHQSGVQSDSLVWKLIEASADCDASTFSGGETSYESDESINIPSSYYGSRLCFTASDLLNNTAYEKTDVLSVQTPRRPDRNPPNIIVHNPDSSISENTKTVSADSDSGDVDDSSWQWTTYDPSTDDCNELLMVNGAATYIASTDIVLNSESYNGQSICFSVSDANDNKAFASSIVINGIDRQAPTVTATLTGSNAVAIDDDDGATTWQYQIITGSALCDIATFTNPSNYVEGAVISLVNNGGQKACFKATDEAGNDGLGASAVFFTASASNTNSQTHVETEEEELTAEEQDEPPERGEANVQNQIDPEIEEKNNNNNFYIWWLLLGLTIFFVILIFARRRRNEEE